MASNVFEKKLSGAIHCAGIAVKQPWSTRVSDSIANFKNMLKVNVSFIIFFKKTLRYLSFIL